MAPESGLSDALSSIPKPKAAVGFMEKIPVLEKLPSGMNYSVVGCEFNISESTIHIKYGVFKQKHTKQDDLSTG